MSSSDNSVAPHIQFSGTGSLKIGPKPAFRHGESAHSLKLKLQLYPIDNLTRERLEKDDHNPYLELTLGPKKKISSVIKHLNSKWASSKAAGELMLFPYDARVENLFSYRRWTLKDSDTRAADVYVSMGSPEVFQLRYGWFSILETKASVIALPSLHPGDIKQTKENQKNNVKDEGKHPWAVTRPKCGPICIDDLNYEAVVTPIVLDRTVQAADIRRLGCETLLGTDSLSNISLGSVSSEVSAVPDGSRFHPLPLQYYSSLQHIPVTCDSFDAAIAGYISRYQVQSMSSHVLDSSILDAEETCAAFPVQKVASLKKDIPALTEENASRSSDQYFRINSFRLHDMLNLHPEHKPKDAQKTSTCTLQLHTQGDACSVDADMHSHIQNNARKRTVADMQCHTEGPHNEISSLGSGDVYKPHKLHKFL